jgi:antitoxin (DNA-binding transcriptional repressor) of toxin-antitoxin stability system
VPKIDLKNYVVDNEAMIRVSIEEIENDITTYLQRVENGETLIIIRSDKEVAELKPIKRELASPRPFGLCSGEFTAPDDFDKPLPEEILAGFEGR